MDTVADRKGHDMDKVACGSYQHEGSPREDDKPCTDCNGTGWVADPFAGLDVPFTDMEGIR